MGGSCSTHGRHIRNAHKILVGKSETDHSEYLGVDRRIILERILEK